MKSMRVEESRNERDLVFKYDATGNRILKIVLPRNGNPIRATSYHRDAQGNVLSTEESDAVPTVTPPPIPTTREYTLYGSSRLGVFKTYALGTTPQVGDYYMTKTDKYYELTNHLGNVMAVLSDANHYDHNAQHFTTHTAQAQDYLPFGMLMPGRKYTNPVGMEKYRYGYNTQEKVDEIAGIGNHYTAEYWEYSPRVVHRWNVDPVTYPWHSSYVINNNNPIIFTDPLGLFGSRDKGEKQQKKAIDRLGPERVGDLRDTGEKGRKKYAFSVYDYDKTDTEAHEEDGEMVIKGQRPTMIYDKKQLGGVLYNDNYYKSISGGLITTTGFLGASLGYNSAMRINHYLDPMRVLKFKYYLSPNSYTKEILGWARHSHLVNTRNHLDALGKTFSMTKKGEQEALNKLFNYLNDNTIPIENVFKTNKGVNGLVKIGKFGGPFVSITLSGLTYHQIITQVPTFEQVQEQFNSPLVPTFFIYNKIMKFFKVEEKLFDPKD